MNAKLRFFVCCAAFLPLALTAGRAFAADTGAAEDAAVTNAVTTAAKGYVLSHNDLIHVKVYQEDDLESKLRVGKDGYVTFPLLGPIKVGGRTVEEATEYIRSLLAKDYLVNPQVVVTIEEYAKRRFTVLGQVARPGTYDFPDEGTTDLLSAISTAGGFTRIANQKVVVTRQSGDRQQVIDVDTKRLRTDKAAKPFLLQPGDTITVKEGWF